MKLGVGDRAALGVRSRMGLGIDGDRSVDVDQRLVVDQQLGIGMREAGAEAAGNCGDVDAVILNDPVHGDIVLHQDRVGRHSAADRAVAGRRRVERDAADIDQGCRPKGDQGIGHDPALTGVVGIGMHVDGIRRVVQVGQDLLAVEVGIGAGEDGRRAGRVGVVIEGKRVDHHLAIELYRIVGIQGEVGESLDLVIAEVLGIGPDGDILHEDVVFGVHMNVSRGVRPADFVGAVEAGFGETDQVVVDDDIAEIGVDLDIGEGMGGTVLIVSVRIGAGADRPVLEVGVSPIDADENNIPRDEELGIGVGVGAVTRNRRHHPVAAEDIHDGRSVDEGIGRGVGVGVLRARLLVRRGRHLEAVQTDAAV